MKDSIFPTRNDTGALLLGSNRVGLHDIQQEKTDGDLVVVGRVGREKLVPGHLAEVVAVADDRIRTTNGPGDCYGDNGTPWKVHGGVRPNSRRNLLLGKHVDGAHMNCVAERGTRKVNNVATERDSRRVIGAAQAKRGCGCLLRAGTCHSSPLVSTVEKQFAVELVECGGMLAASK